MRFRPVYDKPGGLCYCVCACVCEHAEHKQGKNLIAISLWDFCPVYDKPGGLCYCICVSTCMPPCSAQTGHKSHSDIAIIFLPCLWWACATVHVWARPCLHIHSRTGHHAYHNQGKNLIAILLWDFCPVYDKHGGLCHCVCVSTHVLTHTP